MSKTVPNQKRIIIKKSACDKDFLQIKNDEWKAAANLCGKSLALFKLYLYLASNKNDYELALSPAHLKEELGIGRTNYYDLVSNLEVLGFLVRVNGNTYNFYTTPQKASAAADDDNKNTSARADDNNPPEQTKVNEVFAGADQNKSTSAVADDNKGFDF